MRKTLWTVAVAVFAAMMVSAEPVDVKKLEASAKAASTPAEHKNVASQYSERAAYFEAKAKKHEAEVERLVKSKNYNPMAAKWPAVANGPVDYHKRAAVQARRAAEESRQMAARHLEKAGEGRVTE
jgi:hypothetical protein